MGRLQGYTIVSCGTMRHELDRLHDVGWLDADRVLYTAPGLHENVTELEKQLTRQLGRAKEFSQRVIVVYGEKCYINISKEPPILVDDLLEEHDSENVRLQAANCIDMLASRAEREEIAAGEKVYWLTPGWLIYWKQIFKEWDTGKANETFPQHDKAVLLDPLGIYDQYATTSPEKLLEFSDWMKIPIEPCPVTLDRLEGMLLGAARSWEQPQ